MRKPKTATDPGERSDLDSTLLRLAAGHAGDELLQVGTALFSDMQALYQRGLDRHQAAAFDRALASLQQMQELAQELAYPDHRGLRLSALIGEVCSLYGDSPQTSTRTLFPSIYHDVGDRYADDPAAVRALLYRLCSTFGALQSEQHGDHPLRLQVMLDEHPSPDQRAVRLLVALRGAADRAPAVPPALLALAERMGAAIQPSPTTLAEWQLQLTLHPLDAEDGTRPNRLADPPVVYHHPVESAHRALGQRLHRMRFNTREMTDLGQLNSLQEGAAAALIAVGPGLPFDTLEALGHGLGVPLLILADGRPGQSTPAMAANCVRLPACVDDGRLHRCLDTLVRRHRCAAPLPVRTADGSAEFTGGDLALSDRLVAMLTAELPQTLAELRERLEAGDREGLKERAHKLKGGAAYCGVPALHQAATLLDQASLQASPAQLNLYLARLSDEAATLLDQ